MYCLENIWQRFQYPTLQKLPSSRCNKKKTRKLLMLSEKPCSESDVIRTVNDGDVLYFMFLIQ